MVVDPARQYSSPYVYGGNSPLIGVDEDGRWFVLDDLFIAGTNFMVGYISHGLSTGEWGGDALKAGGISAASAWLAYNTFRATAALDYGKYLGNSAIRTAASQIPPAQIGPLNISPSFAMGSNGMSFGANASISVRNGDFGISIGTGIMANQNAFVTGLGGFEQRGFASVSYNCWRVGMNSYTDHNLENNTSQYTMMVGYSDNRFSFMYENDHRTAAVEFGFNMGSDIWWTTGLKLFTGHTDENDTYFNKGTEFYNMGSFNPLAGIAYHGIRYRGQNFQFGIDSEQTRDLYQNRVIHDLINRPHVPINGNKKDRFYFNYSNYSPHSLF